VELNGVEWNRGNEAEWKRMGGWKTNVQSRDWSIEWQKQVRIAAETAGEAQGAEMNGVAQGAEMDGVAQGAELNGMARDAERAEG